jgi:hypothetical protein
MLKLKELLTEVNIAFKKRNQKKLRKLNDQLLKGAVLEFNRELYELAMLTYVLSKIVSKPRFMARDMEGHMKAIEKSLKDLASNGETYDAQKWTERFTDMEDHIRNLEADDQRYITGLMKKGRLKVAATLYAQGLSLGLASEMTGMDKQDILDYAGKTMMFDRLKEEKSIGERVRNARKMITG